MCQHFSGQYISEACRACAEASGAREPVAACPRWRFDTPALSATTAVWGCSGVAVLGGVKLSV